MITLSEDDIKFIMTNLINPALEKFDKGIAEADNILIKALINTIKQIAYNESRNTIFFLEFLSSQLHFNRDDMYKIYKEFCNEYNNLNQYDNELVQEINTILKEKK